MANRWFEQFQYSLEKQLVNLYLVFIVDGVGDTSVLPQFSKGVASVTHTGPGRYQIVLQDSYVGIISIANTFSSITVDAPPSSPIMRVISPTQ
jgi:hypothetical protein